MGSTSLSPSEPPSLPQAGPVEAYTNTLEEYCLVSPVPVQFLASSLPMGTQPSVAEALIGLICCPLSIMHSLLSKIVLAFWLFYLLYSTKMTVLICGTKYK